MNVELVREVKRRHVDELLVKKNVVAVGVGYKEVQGQKTSELCTVISVTKKVPMIALSRQDRIPHFLSETTMTDVVQIGPVRALQARTDKWRPAPGGVSIGHLNVTAGTLGCLVEKDGELFILSNNHVLADSNRANIGDPILQPGKIDGGTMDDQIAVLDDFVPITFGELPPECPTAFALEKFLNSLARKVGSKHRLRSYQQEEGINRVDAAIAWPLSPDLIVPYILDIGEPQGSREAALGTYIKKSGRTTELTSGQITQVDATVIVQYGGLDVAVFSDQYMAGGMSAGGDSGSAVLDEEDYVVGLLFAGSEDSTIINPIQFVLDELGVTVVV